MADRDGHLHEVLGSYAKFLQDKGLTFERRGYPTTLLHDRQFISLRIVKNGPAPQYLAQSLGPHASLVMHRRLLSFGVR